MLSIVLYVFILARSVFEVYLVVRIITVVQFLTQTWLKVMLQFVGNSCSNIISMFITTDLYFK